MKEREGGREGLRVIKDGRRNIYIIGSLICDWSKISKSYLSNLAKNNCFLLPLFNIFVNIFTVGFFEFFVVGLHFRYYFINSCFLLN